MGGKELATGVLKKINPVLSLENIGWVLAGTLSQKYSPDLKNHAGWGTLIEENNLKHIMTVLLPTVWTFHEPDEAPYVFAEYDAANRNPN